MIRDRIDCEKKSGRAVSNLSKQFWPHEFQRLGVHFGT
jgi:hypothetical protein